LSSVLKKAVQAAAQGCIETDEAGWTKKTFRFDPEFLGFQGHFPGYPLLPAFVQILAAVICIEEALGVDLDLAGLDNAKFQREVHPGSLIAVEWQPHDKGPLIYRVRLKSATETVASFVLTGKERGGCVS
jgi:3-hydroxyacyl-[acyl-carrier-protein] dehydratase